MDTAFMRKTFALIAKGLIEKEQLLQTEPTRYPYSKAMQHGINMFLAASQWAGSQAAVEYPDEVSFLTHFITRPVEKWFDTWESGAVEQLHLQEEPFYAYDAFAYQKAGNVYVPSSDCYEFLETQDSDIMNGTDERILYEKIITLSQEDYCRVRRYIIEHPIITLEDRRTMSLELADDPMARDAFQFAYEEITEESYRCPRCGWTMMQGKYGYSCHSTHCTDTLPELTDEMKLDISAGDLYRLKKGIMRYFAAPGKLELEIAAFCEKKELRWALWPQMDRYDVEIRFPDGDIWEIDAKAYRNPIALRTKIQNDGGFPSGDYARGYFAIPNEYTVNQRNYTAIINCVLKDQKNVECVTLKTLKTAITKKEAACNDEEEPGRLVRSSCGTISRHGRAYAACQICGDRSDSAFACLECTGHRSGKSLSVIYPISAYWHNGVYGYGTHLAAGPAHIGLLSFSKILAG